jgi:L-aspartate oxidase
MRDEDGDRRQSSTSSIVIVGGGLAGLFCALRLAPLPVTVLTAAPIGEGASTAWAQGGIAAAMAPGDSIESHLADTISAGAGTVDENIARIMISSASDRVHDLLDYGVPFDRDSEGDLLMSREAAHSERRIVHVKGDMAGAAIMSALVAAVRKTPSIRVIEGVVGETIAREGRSVYGIFVRPVAGGNLEFIAAAALVLATGGVGHLYEVTTNPAEADGSGIGMAVRAGAIIADAEFVQFHPTALAVGRDPAPLLSEALRGEGATLIDSAGERLMVDRHPLAELAPRDIVARAVHAEIAAGRPVFLDCRAALGESIEEEFPTVFRRCREAGIDPAREPVPAAPAEHYHMGGVLTDASGRTSLDGLWACGETASTGAHGANRLASNSLLEAVVFAALIADDIKPRGLIKPSITAASDSQAYEKRSSEPKASDVALLRQAMSRHVGVVRDRSGLIEALSIIARLEQECGSTRFLNMLTAAKLITAAALARTESRGGHYRSDFPDAVPDQCRRSFLTLAAAERISLTNLQEQAMSAVS